MFHFRAAGRYAFLLPALMLATGIDVARAATLTVKNTDDSCRSWLLGGRCLRSAIEYANLISDSDRIEFDIAGTRSSSGASFCSRRCRSRSRWRSTVTRSRERRPIRRRTA